MFSTTSPPKNVWMHLAPCISIHHAPCSISIWDIMSQIWTWGETLGETFWASQWCYCDCKPNVQYEVSTNHFTSRVSKAAKQLNKGSRQNTRQNTIIPQRIPFRVAGSWQREFLNTGCGVWSMVDEFLAISVSGQIINSNTQPYIKLYSANGQYLGYWIYHTNWIYHTTRTTDGAIMNNYNLRVLYRWLKASSHESESSSSTDNTTESDDNALSKVVGHTEELDTRKSYLI